MVLILHDSNFEVSSANTPLTETGRADKGRYQQIFIILKQCAFDSATEKKLIQQQKGQQILWEIL